VIPPDGGRELLDAAVSYALAGAELATPSRLSCPTPCAGWDLGTLLDHLCDSVGVLADALGTQGVIGPPGPVRAGDRIARLSGQVARLRAACTTAGADGRLVAIGDRAVTAGVVAVTGAIELTGHGWDLFAACGADRPVPAGLAAALLPSAVLLITPGTRPGLFADPVRLADPAGPGDLLVAFLGRQSRSPDRRDGGPGSAG
jgi:uncharacterized protein (TIGR03086 family)